MAGGTFFCCESLRSTKKDSTDDNWKDVGKTKFLSQKKKFFTSSNVLKTNLSSFWTILSANFPIPLVPPLGKNPLNEFLLDLYPRRAFSTQSISRKWKLLSFAVHPTLNHLQWRTRKLMNRWSALLLLYAVGQKMIELSERVAGVHPDQGKIEKNVPKVILNNFRKRKIISIDQIAVKSAFWPFHRPPRSWIVPF